MTLVTLVTRNRTSKRVFSSRTPQQVSIRGLLSPRKNTKTTV